MIQLYGELHSIDYETLAAIIQTPPDNRSPIPQWMIKFLGNTLTSHFSGILRLIVPKKEIREFIEVYGVSFSKLELKGILLIDEIAGADNILTISISIKSVDWDVLADRLISISESSGISELSDDEKQAERVAEIVKPFINDTMKTVPMAAVIELFEVLWKDELIKLMESCGVVISEILIES